MLVQSVEGAEGSKIPSVGSIENIVGLRFWEATRGILNLAACWPKVLRELRACNTPSVGLIKNIANLSLGEASRRVLILAEPACPRC